MKLIAFVIGVVGIVLVMLVTAYAQPTPKPSPSPSASFCMNKTTGAMRDALITVNGAAACHKNEIDVSLETLLALQPAPAPSAGPTPPGAPAPTATATPDPSACQDCVIDANGKEIGPLQAVEPPFNEMVLLSINGVAMELPVSTSGFVDEEEDGLQLYLWYPTTNCSGQGYMALYNINGNDALNPIVQVNTAQGTPYVFNTTVWYAQPPYSSMTMNSIQPFTDPTRPGDGCTPLLSSDTVLAGPPASASLVGIGVPPFSVSQ